MLYIEREIFHLNIYLYQSIYKDSNTNKTPVFKSFIVLMLDLLFGDYINQIKDKHQCKYVPFYYKSFGGLMNPNINFHFNELKLQQKVYVYQ